jgi:hypothetical protein
MTSLAPHMEAFLREHLVRHRGASSTHLRFVCLQLPVPVRVL